MAQVLAASGRTQPEAEEEDVGALGNMAEVLAASGVTQFDLRRTKKLCALLLSKYDEVCGQAEAMGWTTVSVTLGEEEPVDYNVCWSDTSVSLERVMRMSRMQRINHFPGMLELVRKAGTARNLNKMLHMVGADYKFFPRTFMLPADYTELKQEFRNRKGQKTFIVKPSRGCQGSGIIITRSLSAIDPQEPNIVQRYLHRPHLLDGYKYDLRLYVLLTSLQPLRIYLFREGLVRQSPRGWVAV
jgi:tubulin polyglutamylase TTLL6/13